MRRSIIIGLSTLVILLAGSIAINLTWHVGFLNSVYCSIGTASTVGCNTSANSKAGEIVATIFILLAIPSLAAVFSMITGWHIKKDIKQHVNNKFDEHRQIMTDKQVTDV